jgi:DNA-binding MarR family transcriptional regulator
MRNDILGRVAVDLLSIPPLTFRGIRRKLIKTTLADIHVDITPLHFEIIRLLEEEGTLHVAEIGERLQIAKAQMTQLIDKLVALNIVEREIDTADRRTMNIRLTDQGRIIIEEHKKSLMNAIRESMSCLTDEDLEELSDSLRKLRDILSKLQ